MRELIICSARIFITIFIFVVSNFFASCFHDENKKVNVNEFFFICLKSFDDEMSGQVVP